jgi:hypothetical protein
MAGRSPPGPTCSHQAGGQAHTFVDSGTLALTSMTAPGIVGADMAHVAHGLPPNDLDSWRQHPFDAARFIFKALQASRPMVGPIIVQETGVTLGHLIEGLIPSLLMAVGVLGATTVLGTVVGGAVGAFAGGFGAAPGAALGGQLGFDIGMAALAWMGLAFIVVSLGQGLPQLNQQAALGIKRAVHAMNLPPPARPAEMLEASRHFAQAQALLFKLILMGLVAWLLKKGAESSALKAEASVRAIPGASRAGTSVEAAEASVADMLAQIRKSRLGNSFADFIELEWRKLIENPKLRPQTAVKAVTKAEAEVVTPSQLAKMRQGEGSLEKAITEPKIEQSGPITNRGDGAGVTNGVSLNRRGPTTLVARDPVELAAHERLNALDGDVGKFRPGEAGVAAEMENYLGGKLTRAPAGTSADFIVETGPFAGARMDLKLTPDTVAQADKINAHFEKTFPKFSESMAGKLAKPDGVDLMPIDTRVLTPSNSQKLFDFVEKLPLSSQQKIIYLVQ